MNAARLTASASVFVLTVLALGPAEALAEVTARDLRTQTTTRWDYQPGQGPKRMARERDFFSPDTESPVDASVPPRPPVKKDDWRSPPRAEQRLIPPVPGVAPLTETSVELGLQVSNYDYKEKELDVTFDGPRYGVMLDGTYAWDSRWFVRGETRFNYGSLDYEGSGTMKNVDDFIFEARGTVGRDWVYGRYAFSPYVGLGYRYLFNDFKGLTSTGDSGYERVSQYLFVPIGVQPRMRLGNGADLSARMEFSPLLRGWQESRFSTIASGRPNLENEQKFGYGLRGDLMYRQARWSAGPFVNYWNLGRSTYDCATASVTECGYEPHNHTVEYGLRVNYRLY